MEPFSALLVICAGKSPVTGEFPAQRPVARSFDVFFDLCLNERLSKQSWGWWFETPSRPLWRHCNGNGKRYTRCFRHDGWLLDRFAQTSVVMSTYLLAFVVGEYSSVTDENRTTNTLVCNTVYPVDYRIDSHESWRLQLPATWLFVQQWFFGQIIQIRFTGDKWRKSTNHRIPLSQRK